jgi:hypothetical protein
MFIKVPDVKCHRNPFSGSCADTCREVGGHDEAKGTFCNDANASKYAILGPFYSSTYYCRNSQCLTDEV